MKKIKYNGLVNIQLSPNQLIKPSSVIELSNEQFDDVKNIAGIEIIEESEQKTSKLRRATKTDKE